MVPCIGARYISLFAIGLMAATLAAAPPERRVALRNTQRAPLPAGLEVTHIAPAENSVWFGAQDRSSGAPLPVVYRWSKDGAQLIALPEGTMYLSGLAVSRAGEAVALMEGRLWAESNGQWRKLAIGDPVERVIGGERFRALTSGGELLEFDSGAGTPRILGRVEGTISAWATTSENDLVFATSAGRVLHTTSDGLAQIPVDVASPVTAVYAPHAADVWLGHADGSLTRYLAGTVDRFEAGDTPVGDVAADEWGNYYFRLQQSGQEPPALIMQPANLRSAYGAGFSRMQFSGLAGPVLAMAVDSRLGTWVSIGNEGAYRLQGVTNLPWITPLSRTPSGLTDKIAVRASTSAITRSAVPVTGVEAYLNPRVGVWNSSRGLVHDNVSCIATDGQNMYFGTGYANQGTDPAQAGGGVGRWDHRQMTKYTAGLPSLTVHACLFDPVGGYVWFGTTAGLARFDRATEAFTTFLPGAVVQDLMVSNGTLWVATFNNGIYHVNATTGAQTAQFAVGNNKTTSLTQDADNAVWIGTHGGGLYRHQSGAVSASAAVSSTAIVQDLETDQAGNLWISIWADGIYRRTPAGVTTKMNVGPKNGNEQRAYRIGRNINGDLWFLHGFFGGFGTPNAALSYLPASEVSTPTPTFRSYGTANGLPANNAMSVAAEGTGAMWFGSTGGGAWRLGESWKWGTNLSGYPNHSSPLLVDLDNNRNLEVVVGDDAGYVTALKPDGTVLWKYNVANSTGTKPSGQMQVQSSPAAADVDGDGEIEVVVGVRGATANGHALGNGGLLILSRTGQLERFLFNLDFTDIGSPGTLEDGLSEGFFATPVLANVDDDPEPEIFLGGLDNLFWGWNADGTPVYSRDNDGDGRFDEDGLGDTTPNTPLNSSDNFPGTRGVDDDRDGQIDEGNSSDDDEDGKIDEDYPEWPHMARDTVWASGLVVDLNNDGQREILYTHDYSGGPGQEFARGGVLRGLNRYGESLPGFPKGNLEQAIGSSAVAVDLDGDGTYEIAHGSGLDLSTVGDAPSDMIIGQLVYAWRANGNPFLGNTTGRFATTEGRSFASFAVGDLDADGQPELVITTTALVNKQGQTINASGNPVPVAQTVGQKLYAFKANGTLMPGFPVRPNTVTPNNNLFGSPVLADVTGDGVLEIIVPVGTGLMIFDNKGNVLPGFGLYESMQDDTYSATEIWTTPAVADIDLDGTIDVVWAMGAPGGGVVRVMSLGSANAATYTRSWPMFRRTASRNGVFGPIVSAVQAWESGGTLNVAAQAFGGRNAISTVTANLTSLGGSAALSLTSSPNAYYRGTISTSGVAPGRYPIAITITDTAGKTDSQTVIYSKSGTSKQIALSTASLEFGSVAQGETRALQFNIANVGNTAVSISNIAASTAEFTVGSPTAFPQVLQPGGTLLVTVRYRPGAAGGARTATLTVSSDDASAATRTVTLTGSAPGGGGTCAVTLSTTSSSFLPWQQTGTLTLQTAPAGCAWTGRSSVPWIQVFPTSGSGQTTIYYTVFPNFSTRTRNGTVTFNGAVWNVGQSNNISTADQRFVGAMYFAFFGREPNAEDLAFHVGSLASIGRTTMVWNFMNSAEFNQAGRFIAGLYVGLLARDAEYGGWLFQRNAFASNQVDAEKLVQNFLTTPEYVQRFGDPTNEEFVRLLYRYILLREASPAEVTFQASQLGGSGMTRVRMATLFLSSQEFRIGTGPRLTAFLLYALLLQRDPTSVELAERIGQIGGESSIRALITEFLATGEFAALVQ